MEIKSTPSYWNNYPSMVNNPNGYTSYTSPDSTAPTHMSIKDVAKQ